MAPELEAAAEVAVFEHVPAEPVEVVCNGRHLRHITDDLYDALLAANQPPSTFIRGGQLTRVRRDEKHRPIIEPHGTDTLRHRISRITDTMRRNKDGSVKPTPPPLDAIRDIAARSTWPRLPALEAVTEIPTLRHDGTIHHAAGYDPATRLLHVPADQLTVPAVPEVPDDADIDRALKLIDEALHDFPFDTTADRANAIGAMLTPIARPAIRGHVPLCLVDAPEPGTGKGLLVNLIGVITTGRPVPMRPLAAHDEEIRKMITAALAEGPTIVALDNIEDAIRSPSLALALTSDEWADRLLGRSETIKLPNRATWMATGNNLQVGGDLARRCYRVRLDARQARPYSRPASSFLHADLLGWAADIRGDLIWALLALARSWYAAGQPAAQVPAIGGFTPWATTIGGVLHNAGVDGFLENLQQFHAEADRDADEWEAFLSAWRATFGQRPATAADIAGAIQAAGPSLMRQQLPGEIAGAVGRDSFAKTLGQALRRKAGRHYGDRGLHLADRGKTRGKVQQWTVYADDDEIAVAQVLPIAVGDGTAAGDPAQNGSGDGDDLPAVPASNEQPRAGTAGTRGDLFIQTRDENRFFDVEPGETLPAGPRGPRARPNTPDDEPEPPPHPFLAGTPITDADGTAAGDHDDGVEP